MMQILKMCRAYGTLFTYPITFLPTFCLYDAFLINSTNGLNMLYSNPPYKTLKSFSHLSITIAYCLPPITFAKNYSFIR